MIVPKRLSIRDLDYDHDLGRALLVTLDGVEQRKVVGYDTEAGTVLRYRDQGGNFVIDPATDRPVEELVRGRVDVAHRAV